jgi:hypothetical protein
MGLRTNPWGMIFPRAAFWVALVPAMLSAQMPRDPGPAVGQPIPAFTARDQHGRAQTFDSLKGPNGLVIVFYRSADW